MNIQKHSELSVYKFGGETDDYFQIHKFLDSSKLFFFNVKHRSILHHTFGVDICTQVFGDTIINSERNKLLVRDIAVEHIKEDLSGRIPTLREWFEGNPDIFDPLKEVEQIQDQIVKDFVIKPYLNCGIKSSLLITYSDFGISLVERILGSEKAVKLRKQMSDGNNIKRILKNFRFKNRWQYTPDVKQLNFLNQNTD